MSRKTVGQISFQLGVAALLVAALGSCTDYTITPAADGGAVEPARDAAAPAGGDGGVLGEVGVAPCDPSEAAPANALYVAPLSDLDAGEGDGSAQNPFHRLAAAAAALELRGGGALVVAEGSYQESLELAAPVAYSLQGAWIRQGDAWRRDCTAGYEQRTELVSRRDVGLKVTGASALALRNLTVRSEPSAPLDSVSRYGLFAVNTNVSLDNVRIFAPPAAAGSPGDPGAPGPAPDCQLAPECSASPTAGNSPSAASSATASGGFEPTGYVPKHGADGEQSGGDGSAGSPGGAGASNPFCAAGATCGGASCDPVVGEVRGAPGRCGCGGRGGLPGRGGAGGGASVGVYVVGKGIELINSGITAGAGGAGAIGGAGGEGSAGTAGATGSPAQCWAVRCCGCGGPGNNGCFGGNEWNACCPGPVPTAEPVAGGTPGGNGPAGGSGQAGGAGAGGPSYALVLVAGARKIDSRSQYVYGQGGSGPAGAAAGLAGAELVVP